MLTRIHRSVISNRVTSAAHWLLIALATTLGCGEGDAPLTPEQAGFELRDIPAKAEPQAAAPVEPAVPPPTVIGEKTTEKRFDGGGVMRRQSTREYSDGSQVNHGPYAEFFPGGQKYCEGQYKDGKRTGQWTYWYSSGQVNKVVGYSEGKLNGTWTVHREDGTKERQESYKNEKKDGAWIIYDRTGEKILQQNDFRDGKQQGKSLVWFPSGQKAVEDSFEDGQQHGKQYRWHQNGQLAVEAEYLHGKPEGHWTLWDEKGRKYRERDYQDGKLVSSKEYGSAGAATAPPEAK